MQRKAERRKNMRKTESGNAVVANKIRKSTGERIFEVLNTFLILLLIVVMAYPLIYVLCSSLSMPSELITHKGLLLWPKGFQTESYRLVFMNPTITGGFVNTIMYLVIGLVINMVLTILTAYVLSRKGLYFKRFLNLMITFTMFFSSGLIPLYLQVRGYGLYNTIWAVILPTAINVYNMIIMRTGFEAVPVSLEESAKLDGANHLTICTRIVVPLSKPILAVIALYYAVYHWNSWYNALIFLRDRELYPLQLALRELLITNNTEALTAEASGQTEMYGEVVKYAAIIVSTVPILCIYPFMQRYFIKGVMIGAVKE